MLLVVLELANATEPTSIVLAKGSATPVGGVIDVAIPAAGTTSTSGVITGWVVTDKANITFTVTDVGTASSTITIQPVGGLVEAYVSGTDFTLATDANLTIVVTTTETGKATAVRTFTVDVS